jgi:hypothetical protein
MTKMALNVGLLLLSFILILSACGTFSAPEVLPPIQGLSSTLAIQTMVANPDLIFLVYTATPTISNNTPTQNSPESTLPSNPNISNTPLPSITQIPSLTPIATLSGSSRFNTTSGECVNAAEFVEDVTIPDDSLIKPSKKFIKIWKLRNIGSCIWTPDYLLVFISGDQMQGKSPKKLDATVEPGKTIDLSIDLIAPKDIDYYQGNWMLQDENGDNFGTGSDAKLPFWVSIKVYKSGWMDVFGGNGGGGGGGGGGGCFGGG